ncbi:hypothetical protein GQ607_008830 [Colletotrichum asianum]|uniref:Uncharacterized protein n=1 Tax=Colletotrichum asianum TaxID=702518 RepID=A0A8H3ZLL9_9PEZI|nr:hypothetical protein GQ607_008830 [Colletotrichum asianum]
MDFRCDYCDDCGVNVQPALGNRENDTSMMLPDGNASPNGRVAVQSHAIGWEAMTTNDGVEYNAQDVNVSYDTELLGNFANSDFFADQSVGVSGINWLSPEYYTNFDWAQPTAVDGTSIPSYDRLHILSSAGNQIVQGPWFDLVAEPLPRIQEPPATSSHDMHDPGQTLGTRHGGSSNGLDSEAIPDPNWDDGMGKTFHSDYSDLHYCLAPIKVNESDMLQILDSILALEFKQEPLLRLGDVKGVLPCPEPLWEKPGLEEISRDNSKTGKKLPPSIGDFGTIVLTYANVNWLRMLTGKCAQESEFSGENSEERGSLEEQGIWGVEQPFADLLASLLQSNSD